MQYPREFTKKLEEGLQTEEGILKACKVEKGRFVEEDNITLCLNGKRIMFIKAFYGREPYYKEWVELFHIEDGFFKSPVEDKLYKLISQHFRRVFVEYYTDRETLEELKRGAHVEDTRIGKKLKELGYVHFRDWYYPEGWMEGGYKIQAER